MQRNKELLLCIEIKVQNLSNKELFKKFSLENEEQLPFCMKYSWWNEVVVDDWDVAVVANQTQVIAIWPYFMRKKGPWKMLSNPHFTPYCGPFIHYPEAQKNEKRISFEHKVYQQLIDQLPTFSEFIQNFQLDFKNALTFIWSDFTVKQRYTYLLDLNQPEEAIWSGFRENIRRQIRKAEKILKVVEHHEASIIETTLIGSYNAKKTNYPGFSSQLFERIAEYTKAHETGMQLKAVDDNNVVHANLSLVWDTSNAYYLIGGAAEAFKNSGALSLLMWQAIKTAKENGKQVFNFEGSIIPAIEKYLRGFGGELRSYVNVSKNNSKSLKLAKQLKGT